MATKARRSEAAVGDRILCVDGTEYEIKDVVRWDSNVFQDGSFPLLPTPMCDWNAFPTLTLPEPIVKHYVFLPPFRYCNSAPTYI